ncbi:MAG: hypothetical protein L0226_13825 [Acidobacteria bacterium]|nr:hypothetical protein [Acidobacteriota bacterium]
MMNASASTHPDYREPLEPFSLQPNLDLSAYVKNMPVFVLESESSTDSGIEDGKESRRIVVARSNACDPVGWWTRGGGDLKESPKEKVFIVNL